MPTQRQVEEFNQRIDAWYDQAQNPDLEMREAIKNAMREDLTECNLVNWAVVHSNPRVELPPVFSQMTSLESLNISGNPIVWNEALLEDILSSSSLRNLQADGCGLEDYLQNCESTVCDRIAALRARGSEYDSDVESTVDDLFDEVVLAEQRNGSTAGEIDEARYVASFGLMYEARHEPVFSHEESEGILTETALNIILDHEPYRTIRNGLKSFVENSTSAQFQAFLTKCKDETKGWRDNEEEMSFCLLKIIKKMQVNDSAKERCELLAEQGIETCGDRASLAFVQMQISLEILDENMTDVGLGDLFTSAKNFAITDLLFSHAGKKVKALTGARDLKVLKAMEERAISLEKAEELIPEVEEIEVFLAYLQPAIELGVDVQSIAMLYRRCSNVSDEDLNQVKREVHETGLAKLIATFVYDDNILNKHPDIKEVITRLGEREDLELGEAREDENSSAYIQRAKETELLLKQAVIEELTETVKTTIDLPDLGHLVMLRLDIDEIFADLRAGEGALMRDSMQRGEGNLLPIPEDQQLEENEQEAGPSPSPSGITVTSVERLAPRSPDQSQSH